MKKRKILTITCHNVYNHGASLQEFALLNYLSKLGYDAAAINYTPDYLSGHFNFFSVDNPKFKKNLFLKALYIILKFPFKLKALPRKVKFDDFSKKNIPETREHYKHNNQLLKNPPEADIYICGSDQIWNTAFENGRDPSFYLNFVPANKKKISYAASFAVESIPDNLKRFVKEGVTNIDYISVRETTGLKILKQLGIDKGIQVLDPVFLLNKNEWEKLVSKQLKLDSKFILIYDFENLSAIKKIAFELKRKYGWKIITINKNINYADKNFFLAGPQEFLYLIKNAEFVLTNSFHALAFSIIFEKQFLVFNRKEKINTRMLDLLKLFNLEKRYFKNTFNFDEKIDYNIVKPVMENHIKRSEKFLKKALENA